MFQPGLPNRNNLFLFLLSYQGQLYKVNVPVVVTQAPAGQQPASKPMLKVTNWKEAPVPPSAAIPPKNIGPPEVEPPSILNSTVTQPKSSLPPSHESSASVQPQVAAGDASQLQAAPSPQPEVTPEENEPSPQPEPANQGVTASPCSQLLDFQIRAEEALTQTAPLKSRDIDDILKEVIEEEREKAERARSQVSAKTSDHPEDIYGVIGKIYISKSWYL